MVDQEPPNLPSSDDDALRGHAQFEGKTILWSDIPSVYIVTHDEPLVSRQHDWSTSAIKNNPQSGC